MSDGDSDSGKWTEIGPDPMAVVCMLIAVIAITIGILVNNNIREDAETDRWTACLSHSSPEVCKKSRPGPKDLRQIPQG
jgi:hypothetical protein